MLWASENRTLVQKTEGRLEGRCSTNANDRFYRWAHTLCLLSNRRPRQLAASTPFQALTGPTHNQARSGVPRAAPHA